MGKEHYFSEENESKLFWGGDIWKVFEWSERESHWESVQRMKYKDLEVEMSLGVQKIASRLHWISKAEHGRELGYKKRQGTDNEGPCKQ